MPLTAVRLCDHAHTTRRLPLPPVRRDWVQAGSYSLSLQYEAMARRKAHLPKVELILCMAHCTSTENSRGIPEPGTMSHSGFPLVFGLEIKTLPDRERHIGGAKQSGESLSLPQSK